ncbi:MAG: hypothetical protein ACLSHO_10605 [Dysosmobacter sp.]
MAAQAHHKKIDGHAPDLMGNDLNAYIAAGVYSDHECHDVKDAIAKLERGQFIMIREGTAARNLEALMPLLTGKYADRCMFCTDDKHPNDLLEKGHIDYIVKRAIALGADPITAVKVACHNAARYFLLNNRGGIAPAIWRTSSLSTISRTSTSSRSTRRACSWWTTARCRTSRPRRSSRIWWSGPTRPSMWRPSPPRTSPRSVPGASSVWWTARSPRWTPGTLTASMWNMMC